MSPSDPPFDARPGIVLLGLSGSRMYGAHHADSDYDWRGVFQAPTNDLLGLQVPRESIDIKSPDVLLHEVGKVLRLGLKANPNILEILWLPEFVVRNAVGEMILNSRDKLLSTPAVRGAFSGFLRAHMHKAMDHEREGRKDIIRDKSIRHAFRVAKQGLDLLRYGTTDPSNIELDLLLRFEKLEGRPLWDEFNDMNSLLLSTPSCLPDKPDRTAINDLLVQIRNL